MEGRGEGEERKGAPLPNSYSWLRHCAAVGKILTDIARRAVRLRLQSFLYKLRRTCAGTKLLKKINVRQM